MTQIYINISMCLTYLTNIHNVYYVTSSQYSFCWKTAIRWKYSFWFRVNATGELKTEFHWALDLHSGNTAYGTIELVIPWQLPGYIHKTGTRSMMNIHFLSPPFSFLFQWALYTFFWHTSLALCLQCKTAPAKYMCVCVCIF